MSELPPDSPDTLPAILFVDDEPRLAELASLALSGRFDVRVTTSPAEALIIGTDPAVRLVLTDFSMDGMTGVELIRRLRETRPDLPCILFSGNLTRASWTSAINAGCRHVFPKPLALASIIQLCTAMLSPPAEASVPEASRDIIESIPWKGPLGRSLRELSNHLLAGHSPLFLKSTGGNFPHEFLLLLNPELQLYPRPDTPPPPRPLFTDLTDLDLEQQNRIAQLIPARRDIPWLLLADSSPEELLDRGRLAESLYLRLGSVLVTLPAPADCPEDTAQLCRWWLATQTPPATLTDEAAVWLATQLSLWNWQTLHSLLREASTGQPGQPIRTQTLQQASLAISLGSDLADFPRYPDYADKHTRQLRAAWESLGQVAQP